jgi:hypothetical protein
LLGIGFSAVFFNVSHYPRHPLGYDA